MSKQRIEEVTLLRGMAFLAITLQHNIAEYIYRSDIQQPDSIMLAMLFHFTRYGTPAFVFLSGIILFYNYYDKLDYAAFIKKRFWMISVPFLLWTVVYWFFAQLGNGGPLHEGALRDLEKQFVMPTYGYQLWFLLMIIQFYIIFPLLINGMKTVQQRLLPRLAKNPEHSVIGLVAAGGILFAGLLYWSYYVLPDVSTNVSGIWQALIANRNMYFLFYSFYFLLGGVAALALSRWRTLALASLPWNALIFIALYIWLGRDLLSFSTEKMNLNVSGYLKPSTFLLVVSQLLIMYALAHMLQMRGGMVRTVLHWIGVHSFGGFLSHAAVLTLVASWTRTLPLSGYHLSAALLTFVCVTIGSLGIAKLLSMIPYFRWMIGLPGKIKWLSLNAKTTQL